MRKKCALCRFIGNRKGHGMITAYKKGSPMLAQYLIINNIQNVAIYKEDGRWQVYIGRFKSGEEQGIKEGVS